MRKALKTRKSTQLFKKARSLFPGGVNSPVRAFQSVGGEPPFFDRAKGAYLYDVDGNAYVDYVGSWGPMIVGHSHPRVVKALQKEAARATSFGAPNPLEIELADLIRKHYPSLERMRFVNSGTEAVMGALRLARAFTKRDKILKFEGCYHGHADSLLVKAGSGALTFGVPTSAGVPEDFAKLTLTAPYNDLDAVRKIFDANPASIACVILEPVVGNSGLILPDAGFLSGLREFCTARGSLLIFDEVMTGFRVALGGAQAKYKIKPDLTTLGKVIGGGLPVGAFGGRREILDLLAPLGPVYQAGTLSGNPLAMRAGIETLKILSMKGAWARLSRYVEELCQGFEKIGENLGVSLQVPRCGAMMGLFFASHPIRNLEDALRADAEAFKKLHHNLLQRGIYLPPSAYEAWFVSLAHGEKEMKKTLQAFEDSLREKD